MISVYIVYALILQYSICCTSLLAEKWRFSVEDGPKVNAPKMLSNGFNMTINFA